MSTTTHQNQIGLADAWQRATPIDMGTVIELQRQVEILTTGLRLVLELSSNGPGREVFANIATEALAAADEA